MAHVKTISFATSILCQAFETCISLKKWKAFIAQNEPLEQREQMREFKHTAYLPIIPGINPLNDNIFANFNTQSSQICVLKPTCDVLCYCSH